MCPKRLHRKSRTHAQGMVEFALVLPILLLVVYGLLEVGRLIFLYTMVATASREAVRYGAATGLNVIGGTERYNDCDGIRAAAQNVDFLNVIDDANITIQFDHGPGTANFSSCPPSLDIETGDRIHVLVTADFIPIVPIVPLDPITIDSANARTILVNVTVPGSALPPPTVAPPPPTDTPTATTTSTPTKTSTPTITSTSTSTATNTTTPTKTPTSNLTPTSTNTPTATPVNCNEVTHGGITVLGANMIMPINNNTQADLTITEIFTRWNNDDVNPGGVDHTLHLRHITLAGVDIWDGELTGPTSTVLYLPGAGVILPQGYSYIVLTFHQTYDVMDGQEQITMQFANNGCGSYLLDSSIVNPMPLPRPSPTLISPIGLYTSWDNTYHWTGVGGATHYQVELRKSDNTLVATQFFTVAQAGCSNSTTCVLTPTVLPAAYENLGNGGYMWRVRDYSSTYGYGVWTAYADFTLDLGVICYTLTTGIAGGSAVVDAIPTPMCNGNTQYDSGTVVQLSAAPASGYAFVNWTGSVTSSLNPITVTMYADKTMTANVRPLSVIISPAGLLTSWDNTYHWTGVGGDATHYQVELRKSDDTLVATQFFTVAQAGCSGSTTCVLTPAVLPAAYENLLNEGYKWRVRDYSSITGYGIWTANTDFTLNIPPTSAP